MTDDVGIIGWKGMRVYIAGPISLGGRLTEEERQVRRARFAEAERHLRRLGYEPVSPLSIDDVGRPWHVNMKKALLIMLSCDAIHMLRDWHLSRGARKEFDLAMDLEYILVP